MGFLDYAGAGLLGGIGADMHNKEQLRIKQEAARARQLREDNLLRAQREQQLEDEKRKNTREDAKNIEKRQYDVEDRDLDRSDISSVITTDEGIFGVSAKGDKVRLGSAPVREVRGGGGEAGPRKLGEMPKTLREMFTRPAVDEKGNPIAGIDGPELTTDHAALNEFLQFGYQSNANSWEDVWRLYNNYYVPARQEQERNAELDFIAKMPDADLRAWRKKLSDDEFARLEPILPDSVRQRLAPKQQQADDRTYPEREQAKYSAMTAEQLANNLSGKSQMYYNDVLDKYVDPQTAEQVRKLLESRNGAGDPNSFSGMFNNAARNLGLLE